MTPFFFGKPERQLFGLYHPPAAGRANGAAALLCYPFGHEAIRVHRFYRLLADRLSRQGVAVLRFDYHGTGDALGEDEDADLPGWTADICEAHRELLRRSGATQVTWFGARLGAALALMAAPSSTPRVQRLVLWDPVFDGRAYLESLKLAHVEELELSHCIPDPGWRRSLSRDPMAFAGECLGFAITPQLREQILALRVEAPSRLAPSRITLIANPQDAAARHWTEAATGKHPTVRIEPQSFQHPLTWTSNAGANNEVVPAEALQKMIGEIHGATRDLP
jgi:pimeloyl-ACP methyl ester carboxylesterase